MTASSAIPLYPLLDVSNHPVNFKLEVWGDKMQHYDFEKPHRHNFYEVLFFQNGGGTHDIDFTTYPAQTRSVHFVASENVHLVLRNADSRGCSLLFTSDYLNDQLIQQLPFSKTNPAIQLNETDYFHVNQLIERIKEEQQDQQIGYAALVQTYVQAIMLYLTRIYQKQYPESSEKSTKPELICRFLQLVQENYSKHLSVEEYAEKLSISTKHLISTCKTHTGKTPLQHIREQLISEAKKLLFHTRLSVKEIAYRLNFDDPTNFSKYFKSVTKYSPIEYREGIR